MSRRMPDPAGLIAGIAFTGIGLTFLVGEVDLANRGRWVWPIVLFSLGAGILAAVLRRPTEEAAGGADASAARTSLSTDVSGSPAHAESTADAEPEPVVEVPPATAPEPVPDEEPGVVEEPAPASGSAADEDAREVERRQPDGPPA
jgi:hypothetical protein